jgi:hypothetical protein
MSVQNEIDERDERYWNRVLSDMLDAAGAVRIDLNPPEVDAAGDATESIRREMIESGQPAADLAASADRRWSVDELRADFDVIGFMAPFVVVRRRSDGVKGALEFTHSPRTYFNWQQDR